MYVLYSSSLEKGEFMGYPGWVSKIFWSQKKSMIFLMTDNHPLTIVRITNIKKENEQCSFLLRTYIHYVESHARLMGIRGIRRSLCISLCCLITLLLVDSLCTGAVSSWTWQRSKICQFFFLRVMVGDGRQITQLIYLELYLVEYPCLLASPR